MITPNLCRLLVFCTLTCYCKVLSETRTVAELELLLQQQAHAYDAKLDSLSNDLRELKSMIERGSMEKEELADELYSIGAQEDPCPKNCKGKKGKKGKQGPPGPRGAPGFGGAVYTRWGNSTCGEHSTTVYSGYAANSNYNQDGGGVNYQCLVLDPEHDPAGATVFYGSLIAGVEYETYDAGVFPDEAFNQNVPCARCYTEVRSAQMMIPGKRTCPEDWTKEYGGYLMSGYYKDNHQYTYECVDKYPEYIPGLSTSTNGGQFYFVRPDCGKLHLCPLYDKDEEITCVVCTR